jgi:transposase-like protein
MAKKGQTFNKYTVEFKVQLAERNLYEGISVKDLAKEYGINPSQVKNWAKKYLNEGPVGLEPKKRGNPKGRPRTTFNSELERLQYENAHLKLEVLRLKKLQALLRGDADSEKGQ